MEQKMKKALRDSRGDKIYYVINAIVLIILALIILYPLYFIVIASISDPDAIFNGQVYLLPANITFDGYKRLFSDKMFWIGYRNTFLYVVIGTALNIAMTIPTGWAISQRQLPFRRLIIWFFILTMFFGGGLIPFYLLVSKLGMIDSPLALIIPSAMSVWNAFMTKAYYESNIPSELLEAAEIDGANELRTFWSIIVPISKPIIAVMVLFYAVGHWNSYFNALIFISNPEYYPLQLVLKDILLSTEIIAGPAGDAATILEQAKIANQLKYASIIVSSIPIIILYPLVQKFFKKGFLVGSFK